MTDQDLAEWLLSLAYEEDKRESPDERRRGQFHAGWKDALQSRRTGYTSETLRFLKWKNLGYQCGISFGPRPIREIDRAFELFAEWWQVIWKPTRLGSNQQIISVPSAQQYANALGGVDRVSESQMELLKLHYHSPERTTTSRILANALGWPGHSPVNLHYGTLGSRIARSLARNPIKHDLGTLVTFDKRNGEWHWIMRVEVAQAIEMLGWVEASLPVLPEEVVGNEALIEGAVSRISVNSYEREPEARRQCIVHYGTTCCICGFDFAEVYGEVARGYIHVHHLKPLSELGGEYQVSPIEDLRPVCPNCHAVIHRRRPPYSIEEVRALLR